MNISNRVVPYNDRGAQSSWNYMEMLNDEYITRCSVCRALVSTLLIDIDLPTLFAVPTSILDSPIIFAVSQDPFVRSAARTCQAIGIETERVEFRSGLAHLAQRTNSWSF